MLASELIKVLQEKIQSFGDLEVGIRDKTGYVVNPEIYKTEGCRDQAEGWLYTWEDLEEGNHDYDLIDIFMIEG